MEFSIVASNPIHIPAVFAEGGTKNTIEKTLQVGQPPEAFTWVNGTPNITMNPIADGGKAPRGQDFNGVMNAICEHTVFGQSGGRYKWSQDVIDNYGGYPSGAIVQSNDETKEFRSLADNNTQNPNSGLGSTWVVYAGTGSVPLGTSSVAGLLKVLNTLTSTDVASALSAAQGKILADIFANFGFTASNNGELRIPVGSNIIRIKWGVAPSSTVGNQNTNQVAVTFPSAFPTACFLVQVSPLMPQGGCQTGSTNVTRFGYNIQYANLSGATRTLQANWLAIGY